MDERRFRAKQISLIQPPDAVFFGSSRVLRANSSFFKMGVSVFNSGMTGSGVEDYVISWQNLTNNRKTPRFLVIWIDPWVFNKNNGHDSWQSRIDLYEQFVQKDESDKGSMLSALSWAGRRIRRFWLKLADLYSWDELTTSVSLLSSLKKSDEGLGGFIPISGRGSGWREDGAFDYEEDRHPLGKVSVEPLRKRAREYASGDVPFFSNWVWNDEAVTLLKRLIEQAQRSGTAVMFISPPFAKESYSLLNNRPLFHEVFERERQTLRGLESQTVEFCDAIDPVASGCLETEFADGLHMNGTCTGRVLRYCFERDRRWANLLSY